MERSASTIQRHGRGMLGRRAMKEKRAPIDTFTGRVYLVGPGGYEIRLSPGSQMLDMEESQMGHLMLPCSRFGPNPRPTQDSQNFVVGDFFNS